MGKIVPVSEEMGTPSEEATFNTRKMHSEWIFFSTYWFLSFVAILLSMHFDTSQLHFYSDRIGDFELLVDWNRSRNESNIICFLYYLILLQILCYLKCHRKWTYALMSVKIDNLFWTCGAQVTRFRGWENYFSIFWMHVLSSSVKRKMSIFLTYSNHRSNYYIN